jgi:hypothetical protein
MTGRLGPVISSLANTLHIEPDRAIVGLACVFGERTGGWVFQPEQFERWLALRMGLKMRVDHGPVIDGRGYVANIGRWLDFAIVKQPVHGLLALGEIGDDAATLGHGSPLLHDLQLIFSQRWLPTDYWGLSIAAHTSEEEGAVLPYEISLTRTPASPDAVVLGVGPTALERWALLTEKPVAA